MTNRRVEYEEKILTRLQVTGPKYDFTMSRHGSHNVSYGSFQSRFRIYYLWLSLLCSKIYLLFFPESVPKIFTNYSYFIPISPPIIPNYSCNFYVSIIIMSIKDHNTHGNCYIGEPDVVSAAFFLQNLHEILLPSSISSPSSSF